MRLPPTPQRSEDTTLSPLAAKKGKVSHLDILLSQNGAGDGQRKTFFSFFVPFPETRKNPKSEVEGGGEPLERLTASRGRGALEMEGAWEEETAPRAGSRSSRRPPPTWHTKRLLHSALTRSFVFSIRASWVGAVRAPRARGAPSPPEQGAGASTRDCGDYRGGPPGWARASGGSGSPRISPPLTRVAPGYQQH